MKQVKISRFFVAGLLFGAVLTVTAQPPVPVSEQSGKITFNCSTQQVGANPGKYIVPNGHKLELTLSLETSGRCSAEPAFAPRPVEFPGGEPPEFHATPGGSGTVVLTELNDNQGPDDEKFVFKARVSYEGRTFRSPDPKIINQGQG